MSSDPSASSATPSSGAPRAPGSSLGLAPPPEPPPSPLKGLARWVTGPSLVGGLVGAALALLYGLSTLTLPKGSHFWLLGLVAGTFMVVTFIGDSVEQRGLATLRKLGEGAVPADKHHLSAAIREAFRMPDRCFWTNLVPWLAASVTVALLFRRVPGVTNVTCLRIAGLGIALGPLTSVITYLMVLERARSAVLRIADMGLTTQEVIAAAPVSRRQLRSRLVFFTAVSVITPTLFTADMVASRTETAFDRLLEAPTNAAQLAMVDAFNGGAELATFGLVGAVVLVGIIAAFLGGTAMAGPLRAVTQEATRIAEGRLSSPRLIPAEDEVWAANAAFATMQGQLTQALHQLRGAGVKIAATTLKLMEGSAAQKTGATEQGSALNETSATTEELARSAAQISRNANEVAELADRTLLAAQRGQRDSEAFFSSMVRMKEDNQRIADSVVRLNKRVQQIGQVVEFINGVGDKADLLALNAELEGTKAGEVGRGFSLVAAEMRRLAENVIRSTQEIELLIAEIRDGTHAAVMATESGMKAMDRGTNTSQEVLDSLKVILTQARLTSEAVRAISLSTAQQQVGTDQLAAAMGEILRITQEGSQATEQMGAANQTLSVLASDLQGTVADFDLEGTRHG